MNNNIMWCRHQWNVMAINGINMKIGMKTNRKRRNNVSDYEIEEIEKNENRRKLK